LAVVDIHRSINITLHQASQNPFFDQPNSIASVFELVFANIGK
jgi:hypothetical protein